MDEKHIVENHEKVLNVLLEKFSDEERALLLDGFNFSAMCALISSEEDFENYRQQISEQIEMWNKLEKLLVKLNEYVKELPDNKSMIDKGINIYEKLNRQERLEFNKRMFEKNTLENSLDSFGYSWNKLIGKLLG